MIFKETHHLIPDRKWQTRRPVKPGEYAIMSIADPTKIFSVIGANGRLKWQVGKDYAVQPGRGKKSIGRTPPIVTIRRERLLPISVDDLVAEGCPFIMEDERMLDWFLELWNSLYRKPHGSEDDPDVWVLIFEKEEK